MDFSFVKKKEFLYPCGENKISCYPIEVFLPVGVYQFECYGASGGTSGNGTGGYGAYVSGNIKLNSIKRMFLFIGAKGHTTVGQPSFNGGGRGHLNSRSNGGTSGGGSTDIRLKNSTELDGLVSRIIVAGAGGGGESYAKSANGGNAGIFSGEGGKISIHSEVGSSITSSEGANVIDGGKGGRCVLEYGRQCDHFDTFHGQNGGFGFGGNGPIYSYGSGGESGYFGGGGGAVSHYVVGTGAGGTSYVSGYEGFHTFELENNELKNTNSEKYSSGLIFYDVVLKGGNETKYDGDGKVIITRIALINCSCKNRLNDCCYIVYCLFMILLS
jgi:hypothetical protein